MTDEEIAEGNTIIGKFMSFKEGKDTILPLPNGLLRDIGRIPLNMSDKLQYHSSWDWLMPIVDKIETMMRKTKVNDDRTFLEYCDNLYFMSIGDVFVQGDSKIDVVYKAVIKFINGID